MTMPRFTAEVALDTRVQHRTSMQADQLSIGTSGLINPARDEVIEIHSCPPGWSDIGGSCWPDPLTESPGGGSGDPGMPGESGEVGEPHGGGKPGGGKPPKDKPNKPPRYNPTEGGKCYADEMRGEKNVFVPNGKYTRLPGDVWFCCDGKSPGECIQCQPEGGPVTRCTNGWVL